MAPDRSRPVRRCFAVRSATLGQHHAVAVVFVEKIESVHDPGVEAAADVLGDFLDDMTPVLEPQKFRARRYGKDGFFTFLAMISELHRRSIPFRAEKACSPSVFQSLALTTSDGTSFALGTIVSMHTRRLDSRRFRQSQNMTAGCA